MNRPALKALRSELDAYQTPGGLRVALGKLLDALLAPDTGTPITCTTCGRVAQPGEVLRIVGPSARVCCPLCMTDADLARWEAQDHADGAPGMHEEIQALIAEVRRLRALLGKVEWAADDDGAGCCPICREGYPTKQHAADCELAAVMAYSTVNPMLLGPAPRTMRAGITVTTATGTYTAGEIITSS